MRVLVTGNEGYLGRPVVRALQDAGHEPIGLDAGFFDGCLLGPAPDQISTRRMDIRDVAASDCPVDAVIHLAALSNDVTGNRDPELTMEINHSATVGLARVAKAAGAQRFLFASSCSIYGAAAGDVLSTEDTPMQPLTPYAVSKVESERDLLALASDGFSPVMLRNATAYGFSPSLRTDLAVNDLTAYALLTGEVQLRSDGMACRPFVHVEDIAAAFVALLEAPRDAVHAKAYNVGRTSENYRIRDLAELIADEVPGSSVTFGPGSTRDVRDYRVSCDRIARDVPGFRPRWTVREGIQQLVEAYSAYGLSRDDLVGERFHRLPHLDMLQATGAINAGLRRTVAVTQSG